MCYIPTAPLRRCELCSRLAVRIEVHVYDWMRQGVHGGVRGVELRLWLNKVQGMHFR